MRQSQPWLAALFTMLFWCMGTGPQARGADWSHQDIGVVSLPGSASWTNSSTPDTGPGNTDPFNVTVKGAGTDIWNTEDSFHFVSLPAQGDVEIVARVASITNTNSWAKAGLMFRESLTANARHLFWCATPGQGLALQRRVNTGDYSSHQGFSGATPVWLKLQRQGDLFTAWRSTDGQTWSFVQETYLDLSDQVMVGLAVTSHNASALTAVAFEQVRVRPYASDPDRPDQALFETFEGITSSVLEPLLNAPSFPDAPTRRLLLSQLEGPVNLADNYGSRLRAYVVPPTSGYFTFWLASDDQGQLFLSTDADPMSKRLVAEVPGWTSYRSWTTYPTQKSTPVWLDAGNRYYLEALVKEGGGSDHVSIGWSRPGSEAALPDEVIHTPDVQRFSETALRITSHSNGANVPTTGLTLSGELVGEPSRLLSANLSAIDPIDGTVLITPHPLTVGADGRWSLTLSSELYASLERMRVLVTSEVDLNPSVFVTEALDLDVVPAVTLNAGTGAEAHLTWESRDIGAVGLEGRTWVDGSRMSMDASGADIWNTADGFRFTYLPVDGDFEVVTRVTSLENTNAWAKAGIMFREALTPESRHVSFFMTPTSGWALQWRSSTGGTSSHGGGSGLPPAWLKLVRFGNSFAASVSLDGQVWTLVRELNLPLAAHCYVGVALTSHNNGTLASASFDPVRVRAFPSVLYGNATAQVELYEGIPGSTLDALRNALSFPDAPTRTLAVSQLETPVNLADNYGSRLRAFLRPTVSGYYTFWLSSDDAGQLFLSPSADPYTKRLIAEVPGWTSYRTWTTYPSQKSAPVWLDAGVRYYLEAQQKEGGGSDHLSIAWNQPNSPNSLPDDVIRLDSFERYDYAHLRFVSHRNGDGIYPSGEVLEGIQESDGQGRGSVAHASITVLNRVTGATLLSPQPLSVDASSGRFSFPLSSSLLAGVESIRVLLTYETGLEPAEFITEPLDLDVLPVPLLSWSMGDGYKGLVTSIPDDSGANRVALARPSTVEVLSGSPAVATGSANTCGYLRLDGSQMWLDAGTPDLGLTSQVSVSAWVRWGVDPRLGANNALIVSNNSTSTNDKGQLWLQHSWDNSRFEFAVQTSSGRTYVQSTTRPQKGLWTHLAGTYDGTTLRLFVNGVQEASKSWTGTFSYDPSYQLLVGRLAYKAGKPFQGDIDELRIFNRALSRGQLRLDSLPEKVCRDSLDSQAPTVTITSHRANDSVSEQGFYLSGRIQDDREEANILISLQDPVKGLTLDAVPVTVRYPDGRWTLFVSGEQLTSGQTVQVTVEGVDGSGNLSRTLLPLTVDPLDLLALHTLNRLSFGATPESLSRIQAVGVDAWIAEQLNPAAIDDSALNQTLAGIPVTDYTSLKLWYLTNILNSRRHLNEVMTWFWENHFSTYYRKHNNVGIELAENKKFRENALGNFRTLLEVSATSPAMLYFLDNTANKKENTNENYARELMELHTLGVDGGYGDLDVAEVARVFTGWRVSNNAFYYDDSMHDQGEKRVLGTTLPANGKKADGTRVLDLLAAHPSTASFLCLKLSRFLVSDEPAPETLQVCEDTFLANQQAPDQLRKVLQALFLTDEFRDLNVSFRRKLKSPLEFLTHSVRHLNATPGMTELSDQLTSMGMELFGCALPTGYAETGADWLSTYQLLERLNFSHRVSTTNRAPSGQTAPDYQALLDNPGLTAQGLLDYTVMSAFQGELTPVEEDIGLSLLEPAGQPPFDITTPDGLSRVRTLYRTVFNFPGYLYQ